MLSLVSMIDASAGGSDLFIKPSDLEEKAENKTVWSQFCHASGRQLALNTMLDGFVFSRL
jgi:hypothetical protein